MVANDQLLAVIRLQSEIVKLGMDLGGTMALVVDQVLPLLDADGAAIELMEGDEFVYRAVSGIAASELGLRILRASSLSGLCVARQTILRSDDTETDERVDRAACRRVGLRSMIVVPLQFRDATVGVLKAMSRRPGAFSHAHEALLTLLSDVVAGTMYYSTRFNADELLYRATHDAMTGLANRALFMDRLRNGLDQHARNRLGLGVLIVDLDGLKAVNDRWGHRAGDALIVEFAHRLQRCARATDTVARLGGDEFGVVLSPIDGAGGADAVLRRFSAVMAGSMTFEDKTLPVTGSLGMALFPEDGSNVDTLLDTADERMYADKRARKRQAGG